MGRRVVSLLCIALLAAGCSGNTTAPLVTADQRDTISPSLADALNTELERVLQLSGRDRETSAPPLQNHNRVDDITVVDDGAGGVSVSWAYLNVGDYDLNGEVNVADLTPIGAGFGMTSAGPDWFLRGVADGDNNGEVNISDVTPIGQNFGNAVTGYIVEATTTPEDVESWTEVGSVLLSEGTKTAADVPHSQVLLEVQIAELPASRSFSVQSFIELQPDIREYGIPTYGEEVVQLDSAWGQIGGNPSHTGLSQTPLPINVVSGGVFGGGHTFELGGPPISDPVGNWYFGGTEGTVTKTNEDLEIQWQTGLGSEVAVVFPMDAELLIAAHKLGISLLDATTGEVKDQFPTDGDVIAAPNLYPPDGPEVSFVFGDTLGVGYRLTVNAGLKFEIDWKQALGEGAVLSPPVELGDALAFLLEGEAMQMDRLIRIEADGSNPTVLDEGTVTGGLKTDFEGGLWALWLDGTLLQRYNFDGSKGTAILPDAGDKFTAFDPAPDSSNLYLGYLSFSGIGKGRRLDWLTFEEQHIQVTNPIDEVIATMDGMITLSQDENGGTVTRFDANLQQVWDAQVPKWDSIVPRISFTYDIANDGTTVFKRSWAVSHYIDRFGTIDSWGYGLGGSRPFAPVWGGYMYPGVSEPVDLSFGYDPIAIEAWRDIKVDEPHGEIPILSRIPLTGSLFRMRSGYSSSSSLTILTTPRIVRSVDKATAAAADAGFTLYEMDGTMAWDFPLSDVQVTAGAFDTDRFLIAANPASGSPATLYCLAELDGQLLWDVALPGAALTSPTIDAAGRCVMATDDGTVSCFDENGAEAWSVNHPVVTSGLMIDNARLYFCSGASLFILSMQDGSTLHEVALPSANEGSTPSKWTNGRVVVSTGIGELIWIDPTDTTPVANLHAQLGAGCISQPICDKDGRIVVATVDGAVQCFDPTGNQLWKVETGRAQWLELSVASHGTILAAGSNGGTYVIAPVE